MTRLFQPPKHLSFLPTTKQEEPIQLVLVVESEILKSISIQAGIEWVLIEIFGGVASG